MGLHALVIFAILEHRAECGAHRMLVEVGDTEEIFTNPRDERTQGYITGRYG